MKELMEENSTTLYLRLTGVTSLQDSRQRNGKNKRFKTLNDLSKFCDRKYGLDL